MNEKVKVIKVELKQEYGEEKLKTYYPEDVELDDNGELKVIYLEDEKPNKSKVMGFNRG